MEDLLPDDVQVDCDEPVHLAAASPTGSSARTGRLPLREDRLHLSVQVERLDRVVDLRPEWVSNARGDALGRNTDLFARSLELPARRADVVENRRSVREVGVDLSGLDRRRGARVGRVALDRDQRLTLPAGPCSRPSERRAGSLPPRRRRTCREGRDGRDVGGIPLLHHQEGADVDIGREVDLLRARGRDRHRADDRVALLLLERGDDHGEAGHFDLRGRAELLRDGVRDVDVVAGGLSVDDRLCRWVRRVNAEDDRVRDVRCLGGRGVVRAATAPAGGEGRERAPRALAAGKVASRNALLCVETGERKRPSAFGENSEV